MTPDREFARAFSNHWREHFASTDGAPVVVAVSGGMDSMALLRLLLDELESAGGASVVAAHFDHRTRGAESEADGDFVEAIGRVWHVPVHRGAGDAPAAAARGTTGPQATARTLRYRFLEQVALQVAAAGLVTAHHRDDRVETVLVRLVRGTSPDGLAGLVPIDEQGGVARLRPLLPFRRADIARWVSARGVPYRDDPSNRSARYLRNRVREEIVPRLRALNPRVDEAVVRLSSQAACDAAWWRGAVHEWLEECTVERNERVWSVDAAAASAAPDALLRRVIRGLVRWAAGTESSPPSAEWIEGAVRFLRRGRGGVIECPGGATIERSGRVVYVRPAGNTNRRT